MSNGVKSTVSYAFMLSYIIFSRPLDSDVIHLDIFGTHLVILNSLEAASELLEKRSAIYSSRLVVKALLHWRGAYESYDVDPQHLCYDC